MGRGKRNGFIPGQKREGAASHVTSNSEGIDRGLFLRSSASNKGRCLALTWRTHVIERKGNWRLKRKPFPFRGTAFAWGARSGVRARLWRIACEKDFMSGRGSLREKRVPSSEDDLLEGRSEKEGLFGPCSKDLQSKKNRLPKAPKKSGVRKKKGFTATTRGAFLWRRVKGENIKAAYTEKKKEGKRNLSR